LLYMFWVPFSTGMAENQSLREFHFRELNLTAKEVTVAEMLEADGPSPYTYLGRHTVWFILLDI